jgi:hypothetical protein
VTSFQDPEFPARTNTSQNAGSADIGSTAHVSALVPTDVAIETVAAPVAAADDAGPEGDAELHAGSATAAASAPAAVSARTRTAAPG